MIAAPIWLAFAATAALIGSGWQCLQALVGSVKSMNSFLGAHNQLLREERARIQSAIPSWRIRRRRKAVRELEQEAREALTSEELRLSDAYDRQAWPWSFVLVGAAIAAIVAWAQVFH